MHTRRLVWKVGVVFISSALVTVAAGQQGSAPVDTGWTLDTPLTGRAIPCESGRIKSMDCENVELLAYLPQRAMDGAGGYDIWGWTDSTTGREFAVVGGSKGTAFVEVTDPVNPKYLGTLPFHSNVKGMAGVKVYKNHAFVVVEGAKAGLQVFDLTQLRDVRNAPATFAETAHYGNFGNAHTITLNPETGFAYPTGVTAEGETCGGGLHMIDVRTPAKPIFAGCYAGADVAQPGGGERFVQGGPGMGNSYVHDAQCVMYHGPDTRYRGREICLASAILAAAVDIVDVTDKQHPKRIGAATYPSAMLPHQGWFTDDQRYFFLDDEGDESFGTAQHTRTIGFDMSNLEDPVVLVEFLNPRTTATDHNLYIRGRYMYQSNYGAGLRIVDIADPKNPKEVGFLDTAPDIGDGPGMNLGSWGNYPFFKKNVVAVASKGLFLVRLKQ